MGEEKRMIWELINVPYVAVTILLSLLMVGTVLHYAVRRAQTEQRKRSPIFEIGNAQMLGKRERQDDSFATKESDYGTLAVVADGIGGLTNGKLASTLAVNTIVQEFSVTDVAENPEYFFQKAAKKANDIIVNTFGDIHSGTTLVMAVIVRRVLYLGYAGDSMAAVYRNKRLIPLNTKQNLASYLEKEYLIGHVSMETALTCPGKKRLTHYIGHDVFGGIETMEHPVILQPGDKVLLYTDGVESLGEIELEQLLEKDMHPDDTAESIIQALIRRNKPNQDNATIIIIKIE